jgi:O-methyltransferase involved in polyketide biosynthesis
MTTARISPTAHYTATVWARNGLAHPALAEAANPTLYRTTDPFIRALARVASTPTIEAVLVSRHKTIDRLVADGIESGRITQVVEVPGGLSSRGARFVERYPDLVYVEGDLPGMAGCKRDALARGGFQHPRHHVVDLDLLAEDGPTSLGQAIGPLVDPTRPTAFITEGLLNYFDEEWVLTAWRRTAAFLRTFPSATYHADIRIGEPDAPWAVRGFLAGLSLVARGRVQAHFTNPAHAARILKSCGFDEARLVPVAAAAKGREPGEDDVRMHIIEGTNG